MSDVASSIQDWEQAIKQVKSVVDARINVNSQGEIEEVHILAGSGRAPKQVVRDIESILVAQFNIQIDHKMISVAQVEDDEEVTLAIVESMRPKLVGVSFKTVNGMAEVVVELSSRDKVTEGLAQGPSTAHNNLRLFVEATLKALSLLTLDKYLFVTEDVRITSLAKQEVALVSIILITSGGEQSLAGCALIKSDEREAVVKATLDAINRKTSGSRLIC